MKGRIKLIGAVMILPLALTVIGQMLTGFTLIPIMDDVNIGMLLLIMFGFAALGIVLLLN